MEWLFTRPVVVSFAVAGGTFSVVATLLKNKGRNHFARQINIASYVFMGISMLLFIIAGFRGHA